MSPPKPRPRIIKIVTDLMKVSLVEETRRFGYVWGGKKVDTFYDLNQFVSREDKEQMINRPCKEVEKTFLDPFNNQWIQHIYIKYPKELGANNKWIFGEKPFVHEYNLDFLYKLDQMIAHNKGIAGKEFDNAVSPETAVVRLGGRFSYKIIELETEEMFEIEPIYEIDGVLYKERDLMNKYIEEWEPVVQQTNEDSQENIVTNDKESVKMKSLEQQIEAQSKELADLKLLLREAIGSINNGNSNSPRLGDINGEPSIGISGAGNATHYDD